MTTMTDVARRAGVSVATVSHVLNETRPVRPDTRAAVLGAIDELGYTHNTLARSLVTSRTRSIGLAVSAISNPYFTEILQGVEAGALEAGYSLLHRRSARRSGARAQGRPAAARAAGGRHDRRAVGGARRDWWSISARRRCPPSSWTGWSADGHDQVCAENTGPMANWSPIWPTSGTPGSAWSPGCRD